MEGSSTSPKRPRGPAAPINPSVADDHGHAENHKQQYGGSSRSSLFGIFRRQPSSASLRPTSKPASKGAQSLRSTGGESFLGALDNMSFNMQGPDLESPQQAKDTGRRVEKMLKAAEAYRKAIETMSDAAAEFGSALYECADTKGAAAGRTSLPDHFVDSDLQAAGGLHLLISNHANILASSLDAKVIAPVRENHNAYRKRLEKKESEFKIALRSKMSALRQADTQRSDTRKRGIDLLSYRSTLLDLTSQIDDINRMKFEFLSDIHVLSTELAESLHSSMASAVTAEIEVFEGIARKGWSGGGLDGLLAGCPDPFDPVSSKLSPSDSHHGSLSNHIGKSSSISSRLFEDGEDDSHHSDEDHDDAEHILINGHGANASSSTASSAKSPNLFSVIPPVPILPQDRLHDQEDEANVGHHNDRSSERTQRTHERVSSDISDIGDLTLTPTRVRPDRDDQQSIDAQDETHDS